MCASFEPLDKFRNAMSNVSVLPLMSRVPNPSALVATVGCSDAPLRLTVNRVTGAFERSRTRKYAAGPSAPTLALRKFTVAMEHQGSVARLARWIENGPVPPLMLNVACAFETLRPEMDGCARSCRSENDA